ncbi:MAG TPA: DUF4375 domain-containing protein [Pirellulales bacterium]|jgi:hypothetical protein|nr:DUF4375 domain-containing protein [Pirellulales bacterium]
MMNAGEPSQMAVAVRYLNSIGQYIKFDNQERIVEVSISSSTGGDEIAAHIGQLIDLQSLTFFRSDLTDEGLRHLGRLVNLRDLSLHGSKITADGLASLESMSQLKDLYIKTAQDLDRDAFERIGRVQSLSRLTLNEGRFCDADLAPLSTLTNLEELTLYENENITGTFAIHLVGLPQLRHLSPGTRITDDGLTNIAKLSGLRKLYMKGPFTNAGLKHLAKLKNLTTLCIGSERVTAEGVAIVAELGRLDQLSLDTPLLADDIIAVLLRCSALEEISFTRSALSDAGLQKLRDELPNCSVGDSQRDRYEFGSPVNTNDTTRMRFDSTTPFLTLLAEAGDGALVDGTFYKIGERYGHWVDVTQYSPEEKVIMLVWHSSAIIDNGGFEYLFAVEFDGDPDFHLTAEAYKTAGLLRGYEAFQEAFALFPGGKVPHDCAERNQLYQAANRSARDRLDRKLWQDGYDGTRERRLAEFIRKNAARLGDLDAT